MMRRTLLTLCGRSLARGGTLAALLQVALPALAQEPAGRDILDRVERLLWGRTVQGDYKKLLLHAKTLTGERYLLDSNRLRLALKGSIGETATIDLQYDNEVVLGSHAGMAVLRQQRDLVPQQYWSLQSDYIDRPSMFGHHSLYRASVNLNAAQTDVRIGRQLIAWGTGRFWSPLDLLNPVTPITLDRTERLGVDAVLVEHRTGPLSRAAWVYAPEREGRHVSLALLWHDNVAGMDYSVVTGRFRRERTPGTDLAAQVGPAVVRGEWTRVRPPPRPSFDAHCCGLTTRLPIR